MWEKIGGGREGSLGILQSVLEKFLVLKGVCGAREGHCFGRKLGFAGYLEGLKLKIREWSTLVGGRVKFENHVLGLIVSSFLSVKLQ